MLSIRYSTILHAAGTDTNPKRKRGPQTVSSLARRVSMKNAFLGGVRYTLVLAFAASVWYSLGTTLAAEQPDAATEGRSIEFARDIQPLLADNCYKCHGPEKQESDFRLDVKSIAMQGGNLGERAIVPGKSGASFLFLAVSDPNADVVMPPKGPRLSDDQVSLLRDWIDQGAIWPDVATAPAESSTTQHWSFQPLVRPIPPAADDGGIGNAIDAFIRARLQTADLAPSPAADRVTLIRRLYLDMLGLPPTPGQVADFVADDDPQAYERLVEQVLDSPRYGERWARHWLDVVRFAETNGFETNTPRPNAFHYRDYVIAALNNDKPYDQFVFEQLAGDAVGADAATGFLVGGAYDTVKSSDINLTLMQRQDELADMINTTGTTFLGLTVGCARCHNHKFDPIMQQDYYALQAVFAGVQHGERPRSTGDDSRPLELGPLRDPVNPRHNTERFAPVTARFVRFTALATNSYEPCLDELEIWSADAGGQPSLNVALATAGARATSSGNYAGNPKHTLEHIHDGQYGNSQSWISNETGRGWVQIELAQPTRIDRIVWGRDRDGQYADRLATEYRIEVAEQPDQWQVVASSADRRPISPSGSLVYAGTFTSPGPTYRLFRGDPLEKREAVAPDALTVLRQRLGSFGMNGSSPEQDRRVALARWITHPDNPLPARVIVNRLWHYHFGAGIVDTPSDFGANGVRPTHPELLDWLACELIDSGWSLKHIHRLILLSSTYRQSDAPQPRGLTVDAQSRLLWRFPPRRLESESIRDSILYVTGALDLRMGGPGFDVFEPNSNYVRNYVPLEQFGPDQWRRMVYMTKVRMEQDATFGAFDSPDAGQVCPKRSRSTTALQALNLLNSNFMLQQAERFAERLKLEASSDAEAQVRRAFALTVSRDPDDIELRGALDLIDAQGLSAFCRAMLNANEFLFLP